MIGKKVLLTFTVIISMFTSGYSQSELLFSEESSLGFSSDIGWTKYYTSKAYSLFYSRNGCADFGFTYSNIPRTLYAVDGEGISASAELYGSSLMYHFKQDNSGRFATAIGLSAVIPNFSGSLNGFLGSVCIIPYTRLFDKQNFSCAVLGLSVSTSMAHLFYINEYGAKIEGNYFITNSLGILIEYCIAIKSIILGMSASVSVPAEFDKIYFKKPVGGVSGQIMYSWQ